MKRRCTGMTKRGIPCKAWAARGSAPPRCVAHQEAGVAPGGAASGGGAPGASHEGNADGHTRPVGAPPGNTNALRHGFYAQPANPPRTIADAIALLSHNLATLATYINSHIDDLDPDQAAQLLALQGQNLSRFSRMLRDQRALSGEAADGIAGAIAQALDELSTELGTDL